MFHLEKVAAREHLIYIFEHDRKFILQQLVALWCIGNDGAHQSFDCRIKWPLRCYLQAELYGSFWFSPT